jgi:hypothetical protein
MVTSQAQRTTYLITEGEQMTLFFKRMRYSEETIQHSTMWVSYRSQTSNKLCFTKNSQESSVLHLVHSVVELVQTVEKSGPCFHLSPWWLPCSHSGNSSWVHWTLSPHSFPAFHCPPPHPQTMCQLTLSSKNLNVNLMVHMISGFHVDKMPDEKELGHKHLCLI